jgi:hypothetical protein
VTISKVLDVRTIEGARIAEAFEALAVLSIDKNRKRESRPLLAA